MVSAWRWRGHNDATMHSPDTAHCTIARETYFPLGERHWSGFALTPKFAAVLQVANAISLAGTCTPVAPDAHLPADIAWFVPAQPHAAPAMSPAAGIVPADAVAVQTAAEIVGVVSAAALVPHAGIVHPYHRSPGTAGYATCWR